MRRIHEYNEEIYDLYFITNIIQVFKSRRIRSAGHAAHRILVGRLEGRSL
jgi:hypothetical protein